MSVIRPIGPLYRLRRGHRLAEGLRFLTIFGPPFGLGRDLVTGTDVVPNTGAPTVSGLAEGAGYDGTGTGTGADVASPGDLHDVVGDITVACRAFIRSTGSAGFVFGRIRDNGGSNTPWSLQFSNPTTGRLGLGRADSGFRLWQSATAGIVTTRPATYAVTQSGGLQITPLFYFDGVLEAGSATSEYGGSATGNASASFQTVTRIGRRADGASGLDGVLAVGAVASRVWSADEVSEFHAAPYALIEDYHPTAYWWMRGADASVPFTASPGPAALAWAGQAASVSAGVVASPGAGALAWSGQAASVAAAVSVAPGPAALAWAGQAGTVAAGVAVAPGAATITLAGQQPVIAVGVVASPGAGALAWAGQQASVAISGSVAAAPGAAALAWQGHAASVSAGVVVSPGAAALVWQGQAANTGAPIPVAVPPAARTYTVPAAPRRYIVPAVARRYTVKPQG
ncbi:hypothetical protein [Sandarakinorhabdus sp.]|uniref:hypothetical protein n=1 Tax=Sandarakinorhabdus sp. TaxID=1916663 RepID=UPI00356459C6